MTTSSAIHPLPAQPLAAASLGARALSLLLLGSALLSVALAGCGPKSPSPINCPVPQILCNSVCVDLSTDPGNCGVCGEICVSPAGGGAASCVAGSCVASCTGGTLELCGAAPGPDGSVLLSCTDSSVDPNNCGSCGTQCTPTQNCVGGVCEGCPSGTLRCPGGVGLAPICRAILSDNANCGGCGVVCGAGTSCDNGACVATGKSNCGNADGGAATSADLQSDRLNCGACGNVCGDTETCTNGRCEPCAVAQCGNACTDTSSDSANCGSCGIACTGSQQCVVGSCGAAVRVTLGAPADGGVVDSYTAPTQLIHVDSWLPVSQVVVDGPLFGVLGDGGAVTEAAASLGAQHGNSYDYYIVMPEVLPDAGAIPFVATAQDIAYSTAFTADKPKHAGTASGVLHVAPPPAEFGPVVSISSTAGALGNNAFIPLGAGPITLSAPLPDAGSNIGSIVFNTANSAATGTLGAGTVSGSNSVITVTPDQLFLGTASVSACAWSLGGVNEAGCSAPIALQVGAPPAVVGSAPPLLTADVGGAHSIWWMSDGGASAQLQATPFETIQPNGIATPGQSDAGYVSTSLTRTESASGVYAITTSGVVDRFNCPGGGSCYQPHFITGSAFTSIALETSLAVALYDDSGNLWFAPQTGGSAITAGGSVVQGQLLADGSGAIYAAIYTGAPVREAGRSPDVVAQYKFVVYTPGAGLQTIGDPMVGLPYIQVLDGGQFLWSQSLGETMALRAGCLTGSQLHLTSALTATNNFPYDTFAVQPGMLAGVLTSNPGIVPGKQTIFVADCNAGTISTPILATSGSAGPIMTNQVAVRESLANIGYGGFAYAVSDDQLKLLALTQDTTTSAAGTQTLETIWLIDLATQSAAIVYSSPRLLPLAAPSRCEGYTDTTLFPHFVHDAGHQITTVAGGAPSGGLAAVPAIVFGEALDSESPLPDQQPMRLYSARYQQTGAQTTVAAVDRFAILRTGDSNCNQPASSPYLTETTAGGGNFLFLGTGDSDGADLFAAPLLASGGSALPSVRLLSGVSGFLTREDTQRVLVLGRDGTLYGGALSPAPFFGPLLFGGPTGPTNAFLAPRPEFGFTSDGAHAYLAVQSGPADEATAAGSLGSAVLEEIDLISGRRNDFGSITYGLANQSLPVMFLTGQPGGVTAFGVDALADSGAANGSIPLTVWGGVAPEGTQHLASGALNSLSIGRYDVSQNLLQHRQSVDGTEGQFSLVASYYSCNDCLVGPARVAAASPALQLNAIYFVSADGLEFGGTLFQLAPGYAENYSVNKTYSPFGGPYTPDYELYTTGTRLIRGAVHPDFAFPQTLYFKQWGSAGGEPATARRLASGATGMSGSVAMTSDGKQLLFGVGSVAQDGIAPSFAVLQGNLPPKMPLP